MEYKEIDLWNPYWKSLNSLSVNVLDIFVRFIVLIVSPMENISHLSFCFCCSFLITVLDAERKGNV